MSQLVGLVVTLAFIAGIAVISELISWAIDRSFSGPQNEESKP